MKLEDLLNIISSRESEAGRLHSGWLRGQMINPCGREAAPASHLAPLESKKEHQTTDTSGQHGSISSASFVLQSCLESKLRVQLPTDGLMMFSKGWKSKATPLGLRYFQLLRVRGGMEGTGFSLWATPNTMDCLPPRSKEAMEKQFSVARKGRTTPANLREQVIFDLWPTLQASDNRDRGRWENPCIQRRVRMGKQINLSMLAQEISACNAKNTGRIVIAETLSPSVQKNLEDGSDVRTENLGRLNPRFQCWLMGYPQEWLAYAPLVSGMPLSRKSRQNLSKQQCDNATKGS